MLNGESVQPWAANIGPSRNARPDHAASREPPPAARPAWPQDRNRCWRTRTRTRSCECATSPLSTPRPAPDDRGETDRAVEWSRGLPAIATGAAASAGARAPSAASWPDRPIIVPVGELGTPTPVPGPPVPTPVPVPPVPVLWPLLYLYRCRRCRLRSIRRQPRPSRLPPAARTAAARTTPGPPPEPPPPPAWARSTWSGRTRRRAAAAGRGLHRSGRHDRCDRRTGE